MLLLKLDRNKKTPVYQQIMDQIVHLIQSGTLDAGAKLPSSRMFAQRHGINRSTAYKAYQELWALGYINCRPGSYSTVRKRVPLVSKKTPENSEGVTWDRLMTTSGKQCLAHYTARSHQPAAKNCINFVPMSLAPGLIPVEEYRKHLNQVLKSRGASLFGYGDPQGDPSLRQTIVKRMQLHGICVSESEVLITNGAQQAMELIFKLLVSNASAVVVEEPTYSAIIPLFKYYSPQIMGVPMTCEGICLDTLEATVRKHNPVLIYTMPNFQNPTGITTSQSHREALLKICEKNGILLLEDGFEEEMKYFGKAVLPIKSMDRNHCVIYVGTFSKVLFPGLRIGWVAAAKECVKGLTALKTAGDISSPVVSQAVVDSFCRAGGYDLHLKKIHKHYRERMQVALQAAGNHFPKNGIRFTPPSGGYTLWISTHIPIRYEQTIMDGFRYKGILVSPGSHYHVESPATCGFRVSIAHRNPDEIEEGIFRMGGILKKWL